MNEDCAPTATTTTPPPTTTTTKKKKKKEISANGNGSPFMGKGKYKFWVLAAILLLSFCSIFTATVTLKWSSSTGTTLNSFSSNHSPFLDDLDVLEIEEREKVVKHMWEVYTHSHRIRLPNFWKEAFEAAYEDLISDDPDLRQSAISEIAKMSIRRSIIDLDDDAPDNNHHHHPLQSTTNSQGTNKSRIEEAKGIKKNKVPSGAQE